jgi:hypothetical protein
LNGIEHFYLFAQRLIFQNIVNSDPSENHSLWHEYAQALLQTKNELLDSFPTTNQEEKLNPFDKEKFKTTLEKLEKLLHTGLAMCEAFEIKFKEKNTNLEQNITPKNDNTQNDKCNNEKDK